MTTGKLLARRTPLLLLSLLAGASSVFAADDSASTSANEIEQLKAAVAAQQKQLQELQTTLSQQQALLQKALEAQRSSQNEARDAAPARPASLGNVASLTPVVPGPAASPNASTLPAFPSPQNAPAPGTNPCEVPPETTQVPAYLRLGSVCIIPIGFMDLTGVWRDKNAGSGIGSNFSSIPYSNAVPGGKLTELRFSPQNSRLGFRADGNWMGAHFIGYNEFDFLGTSGSNSIGITNGAFVPRLRLFWVDVRKNAWEMLAGQSWSLLTPNRRSLSALPGDLFYGQEMDVNYIVGLTWTRQPGIRVIYHPNNEVAAGLSFENPNQQIGGSAGTTTVTLPTALTSLAGTQVDNGTTTPLSTPNLIPDIIFKLAVDPSARFHFEVGGLARVFKIYDPVTFRRNTSYGAGLLVGLNGEVYRGWRLFTTNFLSNGGGRYIFGTAPDFIIRANGNISPVKAYGTVDGVEITTGNTVWYGYYGLSYIGRNEALDVNGSPIGWGYPGSSNAQNRNMQEITAGFVQTFWRNPRYGGLSLITQYEYAYRYPWFQPAGTPRYAHLNAVYLDVRYTLPGSLPNF